MHSHSRSVQWFAFFLWAGVAGSCYWSFREWQTMQARPARAAVPCRVRAGKHALTGITRVPVFRFRFRATRKTVCWLAAAHERRAGQAVRAQGRRRRARRRRRRGRGRRSWDDQRRRQRRRRRRQCTILRRCCWLGAARAAAAVHAAAAAAGACADARSSSSGGEWACAVSARASVGRGERAAAAQTLMLL